MDPKFSGAFIGFPGKPSAVFGKYYGHTSNTAQMPSCKNYLLL
jgi:hypothetical protein